MLTEEYRGKIIRRIKEKVDFSYGDWDPEPKIARYNEGHNWTESQILIDFLPANRIKFPSLSSYVGPAEDCPNGQYHEFAYCQPELVTIRCYAGKRHNDMSLNGRLLADHFAGILWLDVVRNWNDQLKTMGASLDFDENISPRDVSIWHPGTRSFHYIYELSFFILTQLRWDDKPDDFAGEEIIDAVGGINYPNERKDFYNIDLNNITT